MNNYKFELYVIQAEIDGMGFPMVYLFLENNGNCGNGVRTGVIIDFLAQLKIRGLEPNFLMTSPRSQLRVLYGRTLKYNCVFGT